MGTVNEEHIRNVLSKVIDHHVRNYHRNIVKLRTGIDHATANGLDLEKSVHFLKHIWGLCLEWGNQRINYIGDSVQELGRFLSSFKSTAEIHDVHVFSEKLENHFKTKHRESTNSDAVIRATELLPKFRSVGIKTAALIMRFLCLDCRFFEVDTSKLIPPLDRVNYRMCRQLFGEEYALEKFGKERASFGKKATMNFDDLGKQVLGQKKVLIDNLWFIGHFYHDGTDCQIREGAKIVDFPHLRGLELPDSCPFWRHGCRRPS